LPRKLPRKNIPPAEPPAQREPSLRQQRAADRAAKLRDQELRREHYATLPKKLWCQWSGRQHKVINEQAMAYGVPLGEETINLPNVARWLHDMLATSGRKLLAGDASSEIWEGGTDSPALERKREVEYQLRLRDLAERDGTLVSRDKMRAALAQIAGILRHCGDQLQRQFGEDALDLFNETLNECERAVEQFFDGETTSGETNDGDA
jgi:hypothetical protein